MKALRVTALLGVLLAGALGCAAVAAQPGAADGQPARADQVAEQERHPRVDFSIGCAECHEEQTPAAVEAWQASAHGEQSVRCFVCHGDGEVEFTVSPKTETCYSCHSEKEADTARMPAQSCFSCHDGHSLKFHQYQRGE